MASNPLRKLKNKLSAAIDWRVRQEFEKEREIYLGIAETVTDISISYADQITAANKLIEELDRRLNKIENSDLKRS